MHGKRLKYFSITCFVVAGLMMLSHMILAIVRSYQGW